jgi:class 3 adenylate cyclase/tetratricopeptide (TPR) repeat protein
MSFVETVERARQLLERSGRLSLRALSLEFGLDGEQLEALADELVEFQGVAGREGRALVWLGPAAEPSSARTGPDPAREPEGDAGERRQLTVLFCDLVDSTRLAAGMDAEDWRALVQRYHAAAGEAIARFEGHVAQYLGDGLLVYFSWPRAHEDDAERAVRAGLAIVDAVGGEQAGTAPVLAARIGIHTGPVVVGEMGGGERRETLALGDTTNVAARLQGLAEPGTVVMSSATLRLVSGIFETRDRGEYDLKGIAEPVRVHQAIRTSGVRSRLDVTAATELTPFIGRDQELMLLEDRYAQMAEGSGHAVLIAGEAGIGKSRLVQAFRERIAERAHTWLECRGSPYTQDSAFYPVLELHRQGLDFRPDDTTETTLDRIEAGLQAVDFDPAEMGPFVASLHGVPLGERFTAPNLSPEELRKKTLGLLVEWLLRISQRQPLVLLLEDLHWMDPSTVELIGRVLEQVPASPVLLLATYRPDFEPPWGARSFVTPMLLSRFTRAQLGDLVRKAARGRDLPDAWIHEILRRSDGVPLFAEELTKAVLDTHRDPPRGSTAPELHIPDTLQDSLMARLDALGPVKELAQVGSVLGREFSYDLLHAVSPIKETELQTALLSAVREELFYQRGTPPEATYLFKHALIRDAAYQSMLRATRQRHHRRVAETMIERLPEVAQAQPELVAQHWSEAGDVPAAVEWWLRASERANGRADYAEAAAHCRRGLPLLHALSPVESRREAELELHVLLGSALAAALGYAHADTVASWERARGLCDPQRDAQRRARVLAYLGSARTSGGSYAEALELALELRRLGERSSEPGAVHYADYVRGGSLLFMGRLREALDCYDALASASDATPASAALGPQHVSVFWSYHSFALALAGFPDRSRESARNAILHTRDSGHRYSIVQAEVYSAVTEMLRRDWEEAASRAEEALEAAKQQGTSLLAAHATMAGATARFLSDRDPEAIAAFETAIREGSATGNRAASSLVFASYVEMLTEAGRLEGAWRTAESGIALARSVGEGFYLSELHRVAGEVALRLESHGEAEAEALFGEAIGIARDQGAKLLELRAATSLARLWRDQGRREEARDVLAPVFAWFTEGFDTLDLIEAKVLLEELGAVPASGPGTPPGIR